MTMTSVTLHLESADFDRDLRSSFNSVFEMDMTLEGPNISSAANCVCKLFSIESQRDRQVVDAAFAHGINWRRESYDKFSWLRGVGDETVRETVDILSGRDQLLNRSFKVNGPLSTLNRKVKRVIYVSGREKSTRDENFFSSAALYGTRDVVSQYPVMAAFHNADKIEGLSLGFNNRETFETRSSFQLSFVKPQDSKSRK